MTIRQMAAGMIGRLAPAAIVAAAGAATLAPAAAADVVVVRGARTTVTYAHYLPPRVSMVGVDWTRQQQRAVIVERRPVVVVRARY